MSSNLTHEHLDYHVSMDAYFDAKARLFEAAAAGGGTAVVNADQRSRRPQAPSCRRLSPASPKNRRSSVLEARHPDHYHASTLGYEACFLAGLKQLPLEGGAASPLQDSLCHFLRRRPSYLRRGYQQPNTPSATKPSSAFASQFRPQKGESPKAHKKQQVFFLAIDRLADQDEPGRRHYGEMIGVKYGEPFLQKELMKVADVVKLEVRCDLAARF